MSVWKKGGKEKGTKGIKEIKKVARDDDMKEIAPR
jgi:hypothetical protein